MPSILCVVVHPSRLVREGFRSILAESPFEPVCTGSSAEDVPGTIGAAGEQVLVLIGARGAGKLAEAVSAAKTKFPAAHVVVVGDSGNRDLVMTALMSEAASFVDENLPTSSLIKKLELVAQGEPVISVSILRRLLGHCSCSDAQAPAVTPAATEPAPTAEQTPTDAEPVPATQLAPAVAEPRPEIHEKIEGLSSREAAILNALIHGASNKLIADQLKITEATVKVHVKAILRKIRVKNRTQAAIWAMRHQTTPKALRAGNAEFGQGSARSQNQDGDADDIRRTAVRASARDRISATPG